MDLEIRRQFTIVDDRFADAGTRVEAPLRKIAAVLVVANPHARRPGADLADLVDGSLALGERIAAMVVAAMGDRPVQSYGKGGLVGLDGEQEHANALLTTRFANPVRDAIGGGDAWISSFTKVAPPGEAIDIPMNHKDDVYVCSHYDGMTLAVPGAPLPDEIAIIVCAASGGRINARVGGLTHDEVVARKARR